jgi:hypothetical protein
MSSRTNRSEQGSTLIVVLILVTFVGLVASAAAGYAFTNMRRSVITKSKIEKVNAANAGIRYGVDQLRVSPTLCASAAARGGTGEPIPLPGLVGDRPVDLVCQWKAGTPLGAAGFALMVTGQSAPNVAVTDPLIETAQGSSGKTITGPVYLPQTADAAFDLKKEVRVAEGNVYYRLASCGTSNLPSNMTVQGPTPPYGADCTTKTWDQIVTWPALPAVPPAPASAPKDVGGCRVFFPGTYTSMTLGNGPVYFASGVYYLNGVNLNIANALIGGAPGPSDTFLLQDEAGSCSTMDDTNAEITSVPNNRVDGTGVTLILGGDASLYVDGGGHLELFRRANADLSDETLRNVSLVSVPPAAPVGYQAHVVDPDDFVVDIKSGGGNGNNQPEMVSHGTVFTPYAAVAVGNAPVGVYQKFLGGIVASRVDLTSPESSINWEIRTDIGPFSRELVLVATAKGTRPGEGSVIATAALQLSNEASRPVAIRFWHVG